MIYLDYSATTPVALDVMDSINKTTKEYIGNANSLNALGRKSNNLLKEATEQIASLFDINYDEITFTSGATESNNLALIGTAMANYKRGKHIVTSKLEHPSIYAICDYLQSIGFEISYVNNTDDGLIDLDDLKTLIREDTILVSICAVNSELGIREPLKMIRQIIKKENSNAYFHSDMTQAVGKIPVNLKDVDLASLTAHKIYGPKGIGMLYKNVYVKTNPVIYGSGKTNKLRAGTPSLPLIVGFSKALRLALVDLEKRCIYVEKLNDKIINHLSYKKDVLINKTKYSIPQILNISLINIMPESFIHAMDEKEIYLSTNTACSSKDVSSSVMAVHNDLLRAKHTIRISLSYLTTLDEVNNFLIAFDEIYDKLNNLKG